MEKQTIKKSKNLARSKASQSNNPTIQQSINPAIKKSSNQKIKKSINLGTLISTTFTFYLLPFTFYLLL